VKGWASLQSMSKKIDVAEIVKTNDSNFKLLKFKIKPVLEAAELWSIVFGDTPRPTSGTSLPADQAAREMKHVQARGI